MVGSRIVGRSEKHHVHTTPLAVIYPFREKAFFKEKMPGNRYFQASATAGRHCASNHKPLVTVMPPCQIANDFYAKSSSFNQNRNSEGDIHAMNTPMHQLLLDYGEEFLPNPSSSKTNSRRRQLLVQPSDISDFLSLFLSEYREGILDGTLSEGRFRFPKLDAIHNVNPAKLVPFSAVKSLLNKGKADNLPFFHFYIHDFQFERIWRNPPAYLRILRKIGRGIPPDFSAYLNMHPAEQLINCLRNRLLAFLLQSQGMDIIPNACFGDLNSLEWAFDGLPMNSVLAVTTQGCMRNKVAKHTLLCGLHELDRVKQPERLYVYGEFPQQWRDKFSMEIVCLDTFVSKWRIA
ncbi:MAG: DUF4417 domain-containing protein [Victivallales bacterium]|nr:DUF4417 domain-containing protein [Victivallales bacterium]